MRHQAALDEALAALLRDEQLAGCWTPLVAPLRRAIASGDDDDFADAVLELARSAADRGQPSVGALLDDLEHGFARISRPSSRSEVARRVRDLSGLAQRCAGLGYAAGLEQRLAMLEAQVSEASVVDPRTGALRPRGFREHVAVEILRCQRMELPLGVLAVFAPRGADGGCAHAPGAGWVLRENVRRYDGVGCLENGDYVVVLPDVARSGLLAVAERVYRRLCEDPRTAALRRSLALVHLDCVDLSATDLLEQIADAVETARNSDDYLYSA